MNGNELKVLALKQRIGEVVSDYEERVADLRVVVTQQEKSLEELREALRDCAEEPSEEKVVEGDVV